VRNLGGGGEVLHKQQNLHLPPYLTLNCERSNIFQIFLDSYDRFDATIRNLVCTDLVPLMPGAS
jgi:hypothetical protein